jgi:hypothetical protein
MPLDISDLPDARITDLVDKQVNRYQAVAARLANNCVQVKTWCVTAVGAIAALGVNNDKPALFGVALAIVVIFMALDVQYLWLERRFREGANQLVQRAVKGEIQALSELFATRPPPRGQRGSVVSVVTSFTILPFYVSVAALLLVGAVVT